jgi:hypothetical protein
MLLQTEEMLILNLEKVCGTIEKKLAETAANWLPLLVAIMLWIVTNVGNV